MSEPRMFPSMESTEELKAIMYKRGWDAASKGLLAALEKVLNVKWGWDGDCGANNIVEQAIAEHERATAELEKNS